MLTVSKHVPRDRHGEKAPHMKCARVAVIGPFPEDPQAKAHLQHSVVSSTSDPENRPGLIPQSLVSALTSVHQEQKESRAQKELSVEKS